MRVFENDILGLIKERWSARSILEDSIDDADLMAIIEAGSYAPSCFNEQPFRFYLARDKERVDLIFGILAEGNKVWTKSVPCFILLASKKTFAKNGKTNYWAKFDLGTSYAFISLEAQRRGLIAHCMGGFNRAKASEILNDDSLEPVAVVAIGRLGPKELLPSDLQENEKPGIRRPFRENIL